MPVNKQCSRRGSQVHRRIYTEFISFDRVKIPWTWQDASRIGRPSKTVATLTAVCIRDFPKYAARDQFLCAKHSIAHPVKNR